MKKVETPNQPNNKYVEFAKDALKTGTTFVAGAAFVVGSVLSPGVASKAHAGNFFEDLGKGILNSSIDSVKRTTTKKSRNEGYKRRKNNKKNLGGDLKNGVDKGVQYALENEVRRILDKGKKR